MPRIFRGVLLTLLTIACRPPDRRPGPPTTTSQEQVSDAERVVQLQFDAYNKHDIETFLAVHAPDVRAYRFPDSLIFEGRDALRERFGKLFATAPQVHATVEARITHGDFVIWQETATGLPGGKTNTGIFVWEVHNGKISRIMAIR
jgi:hypothetical protein